ncbi:MAG TPA: hypothetical protein DCF45_13425 [Gammaproteobacteria bacterium]|nr:hypothetical protein [Gammaproteobacteria bacterium]
MIPVVVDEVDGVTARVACRVFPVSAISADAGFQCIGRQLQMLVCSGASVAAASAVGGGGLKLFPAG